MKIRLLVAGLIAAAVNAAAAPLIVTNTVPSLVRGKPYAAQFVATSGTPPFTWTLTPVSGTVPALSFSASSGLWSGLVPAVGSGLVSGTILVTVRDSTGALSSKPFTVRTLDPLTITTPLTLPATTFGASYSVHLEAAGGLTEVDLGLIYGWLQASPLPAGCSPLTSLGLGGSSLAVGHGLLNGTISSIGQFKVCMTVQDHDDPPNKASAQFTLNVVPMTWEGSFFPGAVNSLYKGNQFAIQNGAHPLTLTLVSGSLPPGIVLLPGDTTPTLYRNLQGTPTQQGTFNFTLKAEDANHATATQAFSLVVNPPIVYTGSTTLPAGTVGTPYSHTLTAAGGQSPYRFIRLASTPLPAGLTLNENGTITGTPTATFNSFFRLDIKDFYDNFARESVFPADGLQLRTNPIATINPQNPLPTPTQTGLYNIRFNAENGSPPFKWSISAGAAPGGLTLNPDTAVLSGTVTTSGTYKMSVRAVDAAGAIVLKEYTGTVAEPPAIRTASLPNGKAGTATSILLSRSGGADPLTWTVQGSLPSGLQLNATTGEISGTPATPGTTTFTIVLTDRNNVQASKQYSLTIDPSFFITTASLPDAVVNTAYSATLASQGATGAVTWSLQSSVLPAGLSLNAGSGVISGIATAAGLANFTVKATDANAQAATKALSINVTAGCDLTLNPGSFTAGAQGASTVIQVQTAAGCSWNAVSNAGFVTVSEITASSFRITVAANPSAGARSGTVTVQGAVTRTLNVSQDGTTQQTGLRFVPLTPCRLVETRAEYNFQGRTGVFGPPFLGRGTTRTLPLTTSNVCQVPANAKAVVVNVTPIPKTTLDFMILWATGDARPDVWSARSPDGQIVANSAIVKTGPNTSIDVFTSDDTDLVLDINGYFTDDSNVPRLVFYPVTPCRVIETRVLYRPQTGPFGPPSMNARETRRFRFPATPFCSIPDGAAAYSVGITVVPPAPLAFLTAWPAGPAQPVVSNINSFAGRVLANNSIIPAAADGSLDVFTLDRSDFLMDINGYFALDDGVSGMYFYPVAQCRLSSTLGGVIIGDESTRTIPVQSSTSCPGVPATAKAYALTVTALPAGPMPFVTAYPTGQPRPISSILNAFEGQVVTNSTIVPAGTGGSIDVFAYRRTHLVVDLSGYFGR